MVSAGIVERMRDVMIEFAVLLGRDFVFGPQPQGRRAVDGLVLAFDYKSGSRCDRNICR
jgi:hypothetical protein